MTEVSVKRVSTVLGREDFAQVIYGVPCEPDRFNGYKKEYEETIMVYGNTARNIIDTVKRDRWTCYASTYSNTTTWTPDRKISWEE